MAALGEDGEVGKKRPLATEANKVPVLQVEGSVGGPEKVLLVQDDVTFAKSGCDDTGTGEAPDLQEQGIGELRITSERVVWSPAGEGAEVATAFEFPASAMTMHAVSREGNGPEFPKPCVYCQLDGFALPDEAYFSPADHSALDPLFRALAQTALMNPPADEDEEGGGMDMGKLGGFFGEVDNLLVSGGDDEEAAGDDAFEALASKAKPSSGLPTPTERAAMLDHLDSILHVPAHLRAPEDASGDGGDGGGGGGASSSSERGQFDDGEEAAMDESSAALPSE